MLTFNCAKAFWNVRSATRLGVAVTLSAITLSAMTLVAGTAAYADSVAFGGCVGGPETLNCAVRWGEAHDPYIRTVPAAGER